MANYERWQRRSLWRPKILSRWLTLRDLQRIDLPSTCGSQFSLMLLVVIGRPNKVVNIVRQLPT